MIWAAVSSGWSSAFSTGTCLYSPPFLISIEPTARITSTVEKANHGLLTLVVHTIAWCTSFSFSPAPFLQPRLFLSQPPLYPLSKKPFEGLDLNNTANMYLIPSLFTDTLMDKKTEVVVFSATAIALYGYDQGMMSLINTNYDYLATMGIEEEDPLVGVIVSVYYLGCAVGAIAASKMADKIGRKRGIFASLATTALGNLLMFVAGLGYSKGAMTIMFVGRVIMGLGVGGIDSVIPVYSSELNEEGGRGEALAKEFQSNIFGLNMAFAINLAVTYGLGKDNQWGMLSST